MKSKTSIEILLFRIYLIIIILEGPIRYLLNLVNLVSFIYVKDFILLFIFAITLINRKKITRMHIVIFIFILIQIIVAIIYIPSIQQILFFGLKIVLLFLVGLLQYEEILNDMKKHFKIYLVFYIIAVIGVVLNYFITFSWEGLTYSIGDGIEIEATREWTTVGNKRLAGFSRSSFNVATQIMILSLIYKMNINKKKVKYLNFVIATLSIWLTTTKGILLIYILVNLLNMKIFNKKNIRNIVIIACILCMILLPSFSKTIDTIFEYLKSNMDSRQYIKWFASMEDRFVNTWPNAIDMILNNGNFIFGRGLGGIGTAQSIYEKNLYSPADNMFLYLYGTMGIFSIILIIFIVLKVRKLKNIKKEEKFINEILIIIATYGIIANVLEEPFLCILFGISVGYLIKYRKSEKQEQILLEKERTNEITKNH